MSVVVVHFIFDLHFISLSSFHFCIFIFIFDLHFVVVLHLSMFFIHNFFSTSSLTLLWTITGFLHPCYNFSLAHCRLIRDTFIFNHSVNLLAASATVLRGQFLPTGFFYFALLHRHFNLHLSRPLPGSRQFFHESCRASYWSSTQTRPSSLFDSQ